jgi:hypothetical protein
MAAAVIALTAACTPIEEAPSVAEAAGPAADEALATANATETVEVEATPQADSK